MKRNTAFVAGLLLWPEAASADEFCDRQKAYEAAPFEALEPQDGLPDRWVEIHWVGNWLDFDRGWGLRCVTSNDALSRDYCAWLIDGQMSFEFAENFPVELLGCRGYSLPNATEWFGWKGAVELVGPSERFITIEIDFTGWDTEAGAVRYSVYRDDDSPYEDIAPLGPLQP